MLNLGVASIYAQQPVTMRFSGTSGASAINLQQPNTTTDEWNVAGNGALGQFTFRNISAETTMPSSPALARAQPCFILSLRPGNLWVGRIPVARQVLDRDGVPQRGATVIVLYFPF